MKRSGKLTRKLKVIGFKLLALRIFAQNCCNMMFLVDCNLLVFTWQHSWGKRRVKYGDLKTGGCVDWNTRYRRPTKLTTF